MMIREPKLTRQGASVKTQRGCCAPCWAERVKTWTEEWKQQGISEGETKLLRRLLVQRFESLPAWAEARLEQAGEAELEIWADRVLDRATLEEVLKEPI